MGEFDATFVDAWSDEDYARATGLSTIVAADGTVDRAALPKIDPARLLEAFGTMLRLRALDARAAELLEQGRISLYPRLIGGEAAIVGAALAVEADDVIVPGRREAGVALLRGLPVSALAAQLYGNANDLARGRQLPGCPAFPRALNVLPASQYSATQLPHATGIAWAMKAQARAKPGTPSNVALAFLDEGATSAEDFHAGLNFAGVYRVPAIFVCINHRRPPEETAVPETVSETIAVKALAYGIAGMRVDGNDLFAVYAATRAAADRARRGDGSTLIEAVVGAGDPEHPEDPIVRLSAWLAKEKALAAPIAAALRAEVDEEVRGALAAEEPVGPPPLHRLIEDVYATTPPALEEELETLERIRDKTVVP
jgi:pyruvate dehydrogenase E1 component alpha subunit